MAYYIHADMDAFYASVEQNDHSEYRGKPLIVGGLPGDRRSVVSTASYEARAFGVHSAMPLSQAVKLCPNAIFLRGNMERYREKSREVMAVFADFSPDVRQLSVDEAFLDITGTENLFGPPPILARRLKDAVMQKTGLTVSVGLASNKYVAKIASGMSKPDGLFVVEPGSEESFMLGLPVSKIWGAGEKTQEIFRSQGFKSCADIHRLPLPVLETIFGRALGAFLYKAVRGQEAESFDSERGTKSMSAERTFPFDLYDSFEIETRLFTLCSEILFRLLETPYQSRTIFLKIRYGEDFSTQTARETFRNPINTLNDLYDKVLALFRKKFQNGRGVRLIGAGLGNLETKEAAVQGELFEEPADKQRRLEKSILAINEKYPGAALQRLRSRLE